MIAISSFKTEYHSDEKELRTFFRGSCVRYGSVTFISNLPYLVVDPMILGGGCGYHTSRFNKLLAFGCRSRTKATANQLELFFGKTTKVLT